MRIVLFFLVTSFSFSSHSKSIDVAKFCLENSKPWSLGERKMPDLSIFDANDIALKWAENNLRSRHDVILNPSEKIVTFKVELSICAGASEKQYWYYTIHFAKINKLGAVVPLRNRLLISLSGKVIEDL